jgi:hypothetical protein
MSRNHDAVDKVSDNIGRHLPRLFNDFVEREWHEGKV